MELSCINEPLPKIDKRFTLLVFLVTLGATFALWGFPVYFVGLVIAVLFVAGVYNLPELGIAVLVNGLYLVGFFWRGFEITYLVTPLAVVLCTIGLTHYVLNNGLRWRFGVLPGIVLLIGVMLFAGISYSPLPSEGLVKAARYLSMNLYIFFATTLFTDDLNKLKNLLKVIAFSGFIIAVISATYVGFTGIEQISRFTLPGQNPIWLSRGLGMSLIATLFLMELTKKRLGKLVFSVFIFLMSFLIYITASRGPLVAVSVALFFYFFIFQRKGIGFFKRLFFILLIFLCLRLSMAIAPGQIWNRMLNVFSGFDLSTFYRLRIFERAKELFFENPLKGVGTAGFGYFTDIASYPHNIFLEFASELGILGVSAFTVLIVCTAYLGIKLIGHRNASSLESSLNKAYFSIFVFTLINSQVSGAVYGNHYLWFAIAGLWALYCSEFKCLRIKGKHS